MSDPVIFELISHEKIGKAIAELLNARFVQVWATQLLVKPSGGKAGHIGWHQDMQHWTTWWRGEVATFWVAITDVSEDSSSTTASVTVPLPHPDAAARIKIIPIYSKFFIIISLDLYALTVTVSNSEHPNYCQPWT